METSNHGGLPPYGPPPPPRKRMNFWKTMFASSLGTILGGLFLFFLLFVFISSLIPSSPVRVPEHTILKIDLNGEIRDKGEGVGLGDGFLGSFSTLGVYDITQVLKQAKADPNIDGIYLRPQFFAAGWAGLSAIREGILDFRKSGKFVYAYLDYATETAYYLASAADSVFFAPTGIMELNGLAATPSFVKGLLDKLDMEPRIIRAGEFKAAAEALTNDSLSTENRTQISALLTDFWNTYTADIAATRGLQPATLNALADSFRTLGNPGLVLEKKLVDGLVYEDAVMEMLEKKVPKNRDGDLNFVSLRRYSRFPDLYTEYPDTDNEVAVLFAEGGIMPGEGFGGGMIGGGKFVREIRKLRENPEVKAVVLRVNSPGGTALDSDLMWRELDLLNQKKPLVVSMGDVAASGGYYIAAPARKIFARPNTVTGSIGVIFALIGTEQFFKNKLGMTYDRVVTHPYADLGNPNRDMIPGEMARLQESVDLSYNTFLEVVRKGRGFPDRAAVDSIAQGRVWSGRDALAIGLVDSLGSLQDAIGYAALEAGIGKTYQVVPYPEPKDPLEAFFETLSGGMQLKGELPAPLERQREVLEQVQGMAAFKRPLAVMEWSWRVE